MENYSGRCSLFPVPCSLNCAHGHSIHRYRLTNTLLCKHGKVDYCEADMRKLIVYEHISLDGVIQVPGGPDEDTSGGFALGGWISPYSDKVL